VSGAADARRLAFDVIERVEGGAFCDVLVGETLTRHDLPTREAALFTRLVYGTITWQGRLDWTIAGLARRPLAEIDPPVRAALRLALFQLVMLERVPPHAAVHTAVEIAKARAGGAAARFANAVLRAALRAGGELPPPAAEEGLARALAVRWSHPEWLVARWLDELGAERVPALLAANNEPAPTVLRIDLRRSSRADAIAELAERGVTARPGELSPAAVVVESGARAALDLPWAMPQGEASQLVAAMVAPEPGDRIADVCAAPGGKAGAIAEALPRDASGWIAAADRSRPGMRRVRALAAPEAGRRIAPLRADAARPPFPPASFDAVLLDAPCSGLGTLRAHPEIRWRRSAEDVARLAELQSRILRTAAALVRAGGSLVYATCTMLAAENEGVIDPFVAEHPGWTRTDARTVLPPSAAAVVDDRGALRTAPDHFALDGFYAVRLRRSEG